MTDHLTWQSALRAVDVPVPFDGNAQHAIGVDLPTVVINLAHRTDRWEALRTRMAAVGLDRLTKIPAVVGAKLDLGKIAPLLAQAAARIEAPPPDHFTLTRPAVGCFLSHLCLWQWMLDTGLPRLLVFEDDAHPAPGFDGRRFVNFVHALKPHHEMVFVGRTIMDGLAEKPSGDDLPRLYFYNGTFAYIITPPAAKKLMARLLPMNGHIDHEMSTALVRHRETIQAYYPEPAFFEPDWSLRSDCYVPLAEEDTANDALGRQFKAHRAALLAEGRPLLPAYGEF
jgi:GR25 family glycosyltransferase involved in LPS biosynthesis